MTSFKQQLEFMAANWLTPSDRQLMMIVIECLERIEHLESKVNKEENNLD